MDLGGTWEPSADQWDRVARYMSHAALPKSATYGVPPRLPPVRTSGGIDHMYRTAMDQRAQIAKVLITLRSETSTARSTRSSNPATGCDPDRDVAGRELEWRVGDHDFSKACLYEKMCILERYEPISQPRWRVLFRSSEPSADDVTSSPSWRTPSPTTTPEFSLCLVSAAGELAASMC
jgi:hypothetical protein